MFRTLGVSDAAWLAEVHALAFGKPWGAKEFAELFESGAVGWGWCSSSYPVREVKKENLSLWERSKDAKQFSGEGFIPRDLLEKARALRQNQTNAEQLLWYLLRNRQMGAKFRRQHPIGKYVADFCCVEAKLIIELDGSQHGEEEGSRHDTVRDAYLNVQGYQVLRIWNNELLQKTESVLEAIYTALHPHPKSSSPILTSPIGRGYADSPLSEGKGVIKAFILLRRVLDEAEILTLATRPDFRRRGLAGKLLAAVESTLVAQGTNHFFLEVRVDNIAAQKLYQQAGYEVMYQRRNYYTLPDGTQCDALVMQKTIFEDGGSGRS